MKKMIKKIAWCAMALQCGMGLANGQTKKQTIFLWDLHHVLLKPHGKFNVFKSYPHKKVILRNGKLRNKLMGYAIKSAFTSVPSEKFVLLGERYQSPEFMDFILKMCAAQKPMEDTIRVLDELSKNGYTHHVGSNMSQTAFLDMINANKYPQFQSVFRHFDLGKSQVVTNNNGTFLKKPDPAFFKQYLAKNRIDLQTTNIIFIDDKKKNVRVARSVGIDGIHFKNASQLRKELIERGITIQQQ